MKRKFDDNIAAVSPLFVKIYNQAATAEAYKLDDVAVLGYLKALEFLVKDYLKSLPENSSKAETIEKMPVMNCVSTLAVEDLKKFIEETLDERLTQLLGTFEISDDLDEADSLAWDEIRASVEQHRWTPPPGAKSSLDLLREDRES